MNVATEGHGPDDHSPGEEERKSSRLSEHHKGATMATIAKSAGVSQGAISSLLNDRDYGIRVSEKTRERVFKVCRDLGYMPNDLRAVVRMYPELGDLCLLVSSSISDLIRDPFASRVAAGVLKSQSAHHVVFAEFDHSADYLANPDLLPQPVKAGTASKFLCIGAPNLSLFQALIKRGFPVIYLGAEVTLAGVTSVIPDYIQASRLAVEYLFKTGHQRIAILSGPFGSTDQQIIELNRGVKAAYDTVGIPIEAQNIIYGDMSFASGYSLMELLLTRKPAATAIFGFNDAIAVGALACIQASGIKVPAQVSVIGCSDDAIAEYVHPGLTTIHLPAEEIAAAAVREVERRVKDGAVNESGKIVVPASLVERGSCAAPAS